MALARGQASAPPLAGQTLRLADWYVRLKEGAPDTVVNETYSLVRFDALGRVDWTRTPANPGAPTANPHRPDVAIMAEDAVWPTVAERERMRELLFGGDESTGSPSSVPVACAPSHCSNKSSATGEVPCR